MNTPACYFKTTWIVTKDTTQLSTNNFRPSVIFFRSSYPYVLSSIITCYQELEAASLESPNFDECVCCVSWIYENSTIAAFHIHIPLPHFANANSKNYTTAEHITASHKLHRTAQSQMGHHHSYTREGGAVGSSSRSVGCVWWWFTMHIAVALLLYRCCGYAIFMNQHARNIIQTKHGRWTEPYLIVKVTPLHHVWVPISAISHG